MQILVNNLGAVLNYNVDNMELPTVEKYKVDRFAYLPQPGDSEKVVELKNVIEMTLDKIEDTFSQVEVKISYNIEKEKAINEGKDQEFKPVPQDAKVVNLGNFGNRKKKVEDLNEAPIEPQKAVEVAPAEKEAERG